MFENFNNFNFTIYEDAPDEHTVAVDPEMLGHIFENLLEDNKCKGAFYTPKEIVHYMSKESLKAYLFVQDEKQFATDLAKTSIDKIVEQQELNDEEKNFAEKNAFKIIDALKQVKICDPAIGSGAFPMGLLQEIFNVQIFLLELSGFTKKITDAEIKKHIIEESIYGVDIDAGAVDIARLRFWLSLVVDEEKPQPLPNLDFKIICANTLIPLGELSGFDMEAKASLAVKELERIRNDFFNVSSESKLNLERRFKRVQTDLLSLRELTTRDNYEIYTKLYEFAPFDFESAPCSWFDPWWMFGVKDGFDIVIGNPPYVQLQKNSGNLSKQYEKVKYLTFERTGDIYSLFYERGWQMLKQRGVLCFITSNKWMRAGYGESTRKFFAEHTNPVLLIDFAGKKVFENATVDVNILMFTKDKNRQQTIACTVKEDVLNNLSVFVRQSATECNFSSKESWTILSLIEQSIKRKIETVGIPLKDWDINIYRGILTGYNEAFIIDGKTKDELIAQDPKSVEIIRPILRGKDIKRYNYEFANKWLINSHNGVKEIGIKRINIEDYPAVKKYLDSFWDDIKKRADQGDTYPPDKLQVS
ncbi:Eco57I restriction-modification methylase domain-containing protein [Olivibacter sitiensis]|uniref:Eco57I restriction-modification methylase domain-containing protein n=1 Tax=Olivibacter sitiensis TaxID=376470 RepID=UPI000403794E|nr:Eco57I restriction-modification methylase domain-containing protein [Olivibacter sitiensis]